MNYVCHLPDMPDSTCGNIISGVANLCDHGCKVVDSGTTRLIK